jgi:hypothetical protein
VLDRAGSGAEGQVKSAYELAYLRQPSAAELDTAREFFARHRELIAERESKGEKFVLPPNLSGSVDPKDAATLVDFCHALLNANEFVYVN